MRLAITAALLLLVAAPPMAEYSPGANPKIPLTEGTPESEELPIPSRTVSGDVAILPSHDVTVYAPLPDSDLYPELMVDPSITYLPGIDVPRGGKAAKQIIDRLPME